MVPNTIWKYPVTTDGMQWLELPAGAKPLTVQLQHGEAFLWVEVDSSAPLERRRIYAVMTGTFLPGHPLDYIATVQNNSIVVHYYIAKS